MEKNLIKREVPWNRVVDGLLNIPEAAAILRLSKFTVRLFIARGELPIIRLGRRVLIHRNDLQKFIEERRQVDNARSRKKVSELI